MNENPSLNCNDNWQWVEPPDWVREAWEEDCQRHWDAAIDADDRV